jgi:hypothetical protein
MFRLDGICLRQGARLGMLLLCYASHVRAAEPTPAAPVGRLPAEAGTAPPVPPPSRPTPAGPAQVTLEAAEIRGNQELPKVLYIVPWKDPAMVEVMGRPVNSLVDEALAPVDRDVFRRQGRYFGQLYGAGREPGAAAAGTAAD